MLKDMVGTIVQVVYNECIGIVGELCTYGDTGYYVRFLEFDILNEDTEVNIRDGIIYVYNYTPVAKLHRLVNRQIELSESSGETYGSLKRDGMGLYRVGNVHFNARAVVDIAEYVNVVFLP